MDMSALYPTIDSHLADAAKRRRFLQGKHSGLILALDAQLAVAHQSSHHPDLMRLNNGLGSLLVSHIAFRLGFVLYTVGG